jgi:hypothetical protein
VLVVEPTGGLGNRMRVIASALELAESLARPLRLVWTRTPDAGCRFDDLFQPIPGITVSEHAWTTSRIERTAGSGIGFYRIVRQARVEELRGGDVVGAIGAMRRPYVITCSRFLQAKGRLSALRPIAAVSEAVDHAVAGFTSQTIGVHIRRADHDIATQHSPTARFVEVMRHRLDAEARTTFFLATDSPGEEAMMRKQFGDRIQTTAKTLDRSRPEAIRAALVDLLALGRTATILGSHGSSFSEVAAEVGGTPLVVV